MNTRTSHYFSEWPKHINIATRANGYICYQIFEVHDTMEAIHLSGLKNLKELFKQLKQPLLSAFLLAFSPLKVICLTRTVMRLMSNNEVFSSLQNGEEKVICLSRDERNRSVISKEL